MPEDTATDAQSEDRWQAAEEGAELLREGEVEAALTELQRVVSDDASNEYGFFFLGNVWFEKQDFDRALKCYVRALEIEPRYRGAMVAAGHALRMLGRSDQAIRMGRQALVRDKDDADALYLLGLLHFQRGDKAKAMEYFEHFVATGPEVEVAMEVRGMLQVLRGEVVPSTTEDDT